MKTEAIQEIYDAAPFKPFTIRTVEGKEFPVPHREFMSISRNGNFLVVFSEQGGAHILDVASVTVLSLDAGVENN